MTIYLGDFPINSTVYVPFNTFSSVGASVTITGLAVTDIEVYKDGVATTRASDNGYTLLDTDGIDFDGITGIHGFSIDLSDDSDVGFYVAGHEYFVVVASITVDGQTVNFVAATFSIDRWYQEPRTLGQVKIEANAANEGALDIRNSNADGIGTYNQGGDVGLYNDGTALYGQYNVGADTGQYNLGNGGAGYGQYNAGDAIGQFNAGSGAASIGQSNQGVVDGQYNTGGTYGQQNTGATGQVNVGTAGDGIYISGTDHGIEASGTGSALSEQILADFFTVDSGETSATAIDGSVVKEIGDSIAATVFPSGAIDFTYTVTDSVTTLPIEGVEVWISTDDPAVNIVWKGDTDAFGVARDVLGDLPALDPGTYYFWRQKAGYTFTDPDTEVVS